MKVISKEKKSKLVSTFFRNGLKSNLDLTILADAKAGILISINGFILIVIVTASGFATHNPIMNFAFISIILTSLFAIIFSVLAIKPRKKNKFINKEHLDELSSLLYYQDMAELSPSEYMTSVKRAIEDTEELKEELIKHLHIIGSEIKKKYFWLKQAYAVFTIGLVISATLVIYGLMYVKQTPFYKHDRFDNIFEPSGATTLLDGKVLIVEDESANSFKLLSIDKNGNITNVQKLNIKKRTKNILKKEIEDVEALTSDGNIIYAITSHSPNKENKFKKSREKLLSFDYVDGTMKNLLTYNKLKSELYKNFPNLFGNSIFNTNKINIEGLCFDQVNKILLIGFRAPIENSSAIIIGIKNPNEVLLGISKPEFTDEILLDLNGLGIRDFTYDKEKKGFWIIAGSRDNRQKHFQLWFWDRKNSKVSIVENQPNIGFGEGITLINQGTKEPGLLIVEDNGKKPNKSANYLVIQKNSL